MKATIRLACSNCDRDDYDGITPEKLKSLKKSWRGIVEDNHPWDSAWWTHIGLCPICVKEEKASEERSRKRQQAWAASEAGQKWYAKYGKDHPGCAALFARVRHP